MLMMEVAFLLRTSSLSIQQIADRLHLADSTSLSKFFLCMKVLSPRATTARETDGVGT